MMDADTLEGKRRPDQWRFPKDSKCGTRASSDSSTTHQKRMPASYPGATRDLVTFVAAKISLPISLMVPKDPRYLRRRPGEISYFFETVKCYGSTRNKTHLATSDLR